MCSHENILPQTSRENTITCVIQESYYVCESRCVCVCVYECVSVRDLLAIVLAETKFVVLGP